MAGLDALLGRGRKLTNFERLRLLGRGDKIAPFCCRGGLIPQCAFPCGSLASDWKVSSRNNRCPKIRRSGFKTLIPAPYFTTEACLIGPKSIIKTVSCGMPKSHQNVMIKKSRGKTKNPYLNTIFANLRCLFPKGIWDGPFGRAAL